MTKGNQRKRIQVSSIVVDAIAHEARQFAEGGRRCLGDRKHGTAPGPIGPGIVCMTFSVELWLKALGCMSYPTGDVPTGHDLFVLFNGLSKEIQDALVARCGQPRENLLQVLREDARAFETWRYTFEQQALQPGSKDGLVVMTVHLLLTDHLPTVCDQVYEEFKAAHAATP